MKALRDIRCVGCEGGIAPLGQQEVNGFVQQLDGWQLADDNKSIAKRFAFKNFYQTMAFVNAVAWVANQEDHHPDLSVGYDYCLVSYTTHAISGLTKNDFICAAKIDALFSTT